MEFTDVLALRQSVRSYTGEPVGKEDIAAIVAAAQQSPVGMHNGKGYLITVITRPEVLAAMRADYAKCTGAANDPSYGAPLFILVSKTKDAIEEIAKYDAGCIIENMHLAATDRGLGSVYIHGLIYTIRGEKAWQAAAGLPADVVPLCGISIGHSAVPVKPRPAGSVFSISYAE